MNIKEKSANYTIRLAEEKDTERIIKYINKHKKDHCMKITKQSFVSPLLNLADYNELSIRYNLYNFLEEFILIEDNDKLEGIISIKVSTNLSRAFNLNFILFHNLNINTLKETLDYILMTLPNRSIIVPTKIRTIIESDNMLTQYWIDIFNEIGFRYKATKKYELQNDKSVISLEIAIVLNEELIV